MTFPLYELNQGFTYKMVSFSANPVTPKPRRLRKVLEPDPNIHVSSTSVAHSGVRRAAPVTVVGLDNSFPC